MKTVIGLLSLGVLAVACSSDPASTPSNTVTPPPAPPLDGGVTEAGDADAAPVEIAPLPTTTFLYVAGSNASHWLDSHDVESGERKNLTPLGGLYPRGLAIAPNRKRIAYAALASQYGPEDYFTLQLWVMNADSSSARQVTTPLPRNIDGGRPLYFTNFGWPTFRKDGEGILFEWWQRWSGDAGIARATEIVTPATGTPAALAKETIACERLRPGVRPTTDQVAVLHHECRGASGPDGLFLYEADGTSPTPLVVDDATTTLRNVPPSWTADGDTVAFVAEKLVGGEPRRGLFAYSMKDKSVRTLVQAETNNAPDIILGGAISPDGTRAAYCRGVDGGTSTRIHVLDLTTTPPTPLPLQYPPSAAIDDDTLAGSSCAIAW